MANKTLTTELLISYHPEAIAQIINEQKTLDIRRDKNFPVKWALEQIKEHSGFWINVQCLDKGYLSIYEDTYKTIKKYDIEDFSKIVGIATYNPKRFLPKRSDDLTGTIVCRFWCDNVARITNFPSGYETYVGGTFPNIKVMKEEELLKLSCLTREELRNYLPCDKERTGYAIHIADVQIFRHPKLYWMFNHWEKVLIDTDDMPAYYDDRLMPLCQVPKNWCYVEVEE